MMRSWINVAVVSLVLSTGCGGNPRDLPLPANLESVAEDKELVAAMQELPEEEQELLGRYLLRRALGDAFGLQPAGVTLSVGAAIDAQAKWEAAQEVEAAAADALAAKVKAELEAKQKELRDVVTVALADKSLLPQNYNARRYSDAVALTIAFENKSTKNVSGVKGLLVFSDMFDVAFKRLNLSYDDGISAGATAVWHGEMKVNEFIPADVKLAQMPLEKLKVRWEPEVILFADGTSLKAE